MCKVTPELVRLAIETFGTEEWLFNPNEKELSALNELYPTGCIRYKYHNGYDCMGYLVCGQIASHRMSRLLETPVLALGGA